MAFRDDLRVMLRDNPTNVANRRYTDSALDTFGRLALTDLNSWPPARTYQYADIDAASVVPEYYRLLALYWAQILALRSELDTDGLSKVQSQDSMIDPGNAATGMERQIRGLEKEFDRRVRQWIGVDWGALIYKTPEEFIEL